MKELPLTKGRVALVDDADYPAVSQYKWSVTDKRGKLYAVRRIHLGPVKKYVYAGQTEYLHNFIMTPAPGQVVDHISGDTLDCQRANMRKCSPTENSWNHKLSRNNTSGYKGVVRFKKTDKWVAQIMVNRQHVYLGIFPTREDAARAYDAKARECFGKFALTNFPEAAP